MFSTTLQFTNHFPRRFALLYGQRPRPMATTSIANSTSVGDPPVALLWHSFRSSRDYKQACRITSHAVSQSLSSFARSLAVVGSANNYEAVLVTVLVPSATSATESLRVLKRVSNGLTDLCLQRGVIFLFSTTELHRVQPRSKEDKAQESPKGKEKKKTSAPKISDMDEQHTQEVAEERTLFGNAHLHAVVSAPREFIRLLPLALSSLEAPDVLDVTCRSIGRTVPRPGSSAEPNTGQENYYTWQLTNALRYIAKEYRLEARELFFSKLNRELPLLHKPKFDLLISQELLNTDPEALEKSRKKLLDRFPEGSLMLQCGRGGVLLLPGGSHLRKLSFLVDQFLRLNGLFLGTRVLDGKIQSFIISTPHGGYVGGFNERAIVSPEQLFDSLMKFYSAHSPSGEINDYLVENARKFYLMARSASFFLSPDVAERRSLDAAVLRGGGAIFWEKATSPKSMYFQRDWGQRQALRHDAQRTSAIARIGLQQSAIPLEEQLSFSPPFKHLQDYFRQPDHTPEALAAKTSLFLYTLGMLLRPGPKSEHALLFFGPSGTGKTPFLGTLANRFWGEECVDHVFIRGTNFDLQGSEDADVLLWDELSPLSRQWKNHLKLMLSPQKVRVDRKNIAATTVSYHHKVFLFTSNYSPTELFTDQIKAMRKRCRFFLITNKPNAVQRGGYDMPALLNSTDSILLGALHMSSGDRFRQLQSAPPTDDLWVDALKQTQTACLNVLKPELSRELDPFHPAALPLPSQLRLKTLLALEEAHGDLSSEDEGVSFD